MTAFANHFSFEFRTGIRNKSLLLLNYLFPLGFYLMAGALMTSLNPAFRDTLIPAMMFFTALSSTLLGMPDPVVSAREAGIFRSYKIHGVPRTAALLIPALTTMLHTVITATIIALTAPLLFQAPAPADIPALVLAFVLLLLACAGLGLLIGVIAPNSRSTVLMAQVVFLPSMMIGGLMVPASQLPEALAKIALLLPSTHAMNMVQPGSVGAVTDLASAVVLLAGAALAFGLAIYLFEWDSHNKMRRMRPTLAALALVPYVVATLLALI